jgi:pSer/pThr/pTyr-binding forkhead associated (FHA) protein
MLEWIKATADAGMLVRLSFPKGEHQDVFVTPGLTTIGSAADNTVVLPGPDVQPHHATLVIDQRGVVLQVAGAEARTHVNARPVREMALLRIGDVVSLDSINMLLKPDNDESVRRPVPSAEATAQATDAMAQISDDPNDTRYRAMPPRAVLRGVSGPYFGKVVPIVGRLTIGRGEECDLVLDEPEMSRKHAMIEISAGEIYLRDQGSANGTFVNGVQVRDAALYTGDQLAFDRNRFLIEAPGMPVRRNEPRTDQTSAVDARTPMVTQTMRAIRSDDMASAAPGATPIPTNSGSWNPWWLIAAGALIALVVAALLLVRVN